MKGYVYVLTNEAMPGLVKIGRSKHAAGVRAKQIYSGDTGVPLPFDVHFECLFDDCIEAEASVHGELDDFRVNPVREFFKIDPDEAVIQVLKTKAWDYDHEIQHADLAVDEPTILRMAHDAQIVAPDAIAALEWLLPADVRRALLRRNAGRARVKARFERSKSHLTVVGK